MVPNTAGAIKGQGVSTGTSDMETKKLKAFEDPRKPGNSDKWHTGRPCIIPGCNAPAGTAWGPHWCFKHNVERIRCIDNQFLRMLDNKEV